MPESATLSNTSLAARTRAPHLRSIALATLVACAPAAAVQSQKGPMPATPETVRGTAAEARDGDKPKGSRAGEVKAKPSGGKAGQRETGGVSVRERRAAPKSAGNIAVDAPPSKAEPTANDEDVSAGATDAEPDKAAPSVETPAKGEASARGDVDAELGEMRTRLNESKPGAERARLRRAYVERLVELDRRAEAVAELRAMIVEERFDPPYFYNTGNALARLGESNAAVEAYRKAVEQRHGNYARAQHNLGVVLIRLGRWEEAEEALTAALRQENFTYAEASYNLGRLYSLRGEAGLAIDEWTRTLRLRPDHANAAAALARSLAEDGDSERALAVLDAFSARQNTRGATAPREIAVTRGEIIAARNLAAEEKNSGGERTIRSSSTGTASASLKSASVGSGNREARASSSLRSLSVDPQTYELLRRARAARESGNNEQAATLYRRVIQNSGTAREDNASGDDEADELMRATSCPVRTACGSGRACACVSTRPLPQAVLTEYAPRVFAFNRKPL
ncbi:MAG: tetratricopeptide repeat protein [Acidobacteria bacterium]|nr:tetratricopeptide repeat protein [Acidobacteriota bacterium]